MGRRRTIRQGDQVSPAELRQAEPEADLQRAGDELAAALGWRIVLGLPSYVLRCARCGAECAWGRQVAAGWPDRLYSRRDARRTRLVAVEYKSAAGRLEPEQAEVLVLLAEGGLEVLVCGPDDFGSLREALE